MLTWPTTKQGCRITCSASGLCGPLMKFRAVFPSNGSSSNNPQLGPVVPYTSCAPRPVRGSPAATGSHPTFPLRVRTALGCRLTSFKQGKGEAAVRLYSLKAELVQGSRVLGAVGASFLQRTLPSWELNSTGRRWASRPGSLRGAGRSDADATCPCQPSKPQALHGTAPEMRLRR